MIQFGLIDLTVCMLALLAAHRVLLGSFPIVCGIITPACRHAPATDVLADRPSRAPAADGPQLHECAWSDCRTLTLDRWCEAHSEMRADIAAEGRE